MSGRNRLKAVVDSPWAMLLRGALLRKQVAAEQKKVKEIAKALNLPLFSRNAVVPLLRRENDTFFILGSGASVNALTPSHFQEIASGFSVGINAWVSHDFAPNAYSFEGDGIPEPASAEILTMSRALLKKSKSSKDLVLFLLRPKRADLAHRTVVVPESLRPRAFVYGRQNLVTKFLPNLYRDLAWSIPRFPGRACDSVVIDNGASVVRLISIARVLGFTKIVLVGIDLNASPYFWNSSDASKKTLEEFRDYPRPTMSRHDTLETGNRPFSTLDFIVALSNVVSDKAGIEIFNGSSSSSLSDHLLDYPWQHGKNGSGQNA
jgi:hypothetical protein